MARVPPTASHNEVSSVASDAWRGGGWCQAQGPAARSGKGSQEEGGSWPAAAWLPGCPLSVPVGVSVIPSGAAGATALPSGGTFEDMEGGWGSAEGRE